MFRNILSCISRLWDLLCESLSSTTDSQTPSSSVSDSMASSTSQTPSSSDSDSLACTSQTPSFSTASCSMASTSSLTPSTNASTTSTPTSWDVFLSFRGSDTRYKFTSHLYSALDRHGIRTFMDDPELRSGEVISDALLQAIRESKTYIVVFSENYASSPWCLDELVEIHKFYKAMGRLVVPVFCNIEPWVVRHQGQSFKDAFEMYETRYMGEREKLENWRLALKEVANFSGKHISENRSEADIISEIVDVILLQINTKNLDVAKYPVGLDNRVKDITELMLSSVTEGVIKIGLYGMGGVGKTTLAKALYNQLLPGGSFKGNSFLADVREVSGTPKGLVILQQQIIDDVLKSKKVVEVHNVEEGTKFIRERICPSKVLVLIDDIDNVEQYESLAGPFASGSVVIITTRDEEILDRIKVEPKYRYRVNVLNGVQSLTLFTQYAFQNSKPDNNLMLLSKDILGLAGGHPLALKVFGSHLSSKTSEVGWKSYIETLKKNPNSTIEQKFVYSLDALELDDPMLKKIFIDIACFFIGQKKKEVVKIMDTYYSFADDKMDTLKKKCLLTINERDELEMHDLLRDTGRKVTRNNAPDEPGKYSRLWVAHDIRDVLEKHKGTEAIEGIIPSNFNYQHSLEGVSFATETFKRMSKLRFLYLNNVNLTGNFKQIFDDLRWFSWDNCPSKCFPSEFYPHKLVILNLPCSKMRTMCYKNKVYHVFEKLKALNMSCSLDLTTTPDFTMLPCLETLNLKGCKGLKQVHASIGSLVRLVSLNLHDCVTLRSLPDTICDLRALEILNIGHCSSLEALPTEFGNIESLKELNADGLNVLKLPDSIGRLGKLVKLKFGRNKNIKSLPNTICNLRALEILNIGHCSSLEALPTEFGNIDALKELDAREVSLSKLPDSIGRLGKLVELNLNLNKCLETLPDTIGNLRSLEYLHISGCDKLEILPDQLWMLTGLKELTMDHGTTKKLPDIKSIQRGFLLEKLCVPRNFIAALPNGFSQLLNLKYLDLRNCEHLFSIPELPPNLKKIDASGCMSLERLPNLSNLKVLEEFDLTGCSSLTEIHGLAEITSLNVLNLTGCDSLGSSTFTRRLAQNYSLVGHATLIYGSLSWDRHLSPDWNISTGELTVLHPHDSRISLASSPDVVGIIMSLELYMFQFYYEPIYFKVTNTKSDYVWRRRFETSKERDLGSVIIPTSLFSDKDGDGIFNFKSEESRIYSIYLVRKTGITTIEECDGTTISAEDA